MTIDSHDDSLSANNTFDNADGYQASTLAASIFVKKDLFAFKSKKDFLVETEDTVSARASPDFMLIGRRDNFKPEHTRAADNNTIWHESSMTTPEKNVKDNLMY